MKSHFKKRKTCEVFLIVGLIFLVANCRLTAAGEEGNVPLGVSIEILLDKSEGRGRPLVFLKNNTDRQIRYMSVGVTRGWRIKVFNMKGEVIGEAGFEPFKGGSVEFIRIEPGGEVKSHLDVRWGVLKNKDIPEVCRVEIETPPFEGEGGNLSAKVVTPMKLLDEEERPAGGQR